MSSCVASCFISCRAASCAFATSVSSQTGGARNCFHFVSAFSSHPINHQHALPPRLPSPRARSGTVRSVAESCRSSSGSLRRNFLVLRHPRWLYVSYLSAMQNCSSIQTFVGTRRASPLCYPTLQPCCTVRNGNPDSLQNRTNPIQNP